METSTLLTYLENSLSSDNAARKASESFLLTNKVSLVSPLLALLVDNNNITTQLQLVALTLVKNAIASIDNKDQKYGGLLNETIQQTLRYMENFEDPFSHNASILIKMALKILDTIIRQERSNYDEELSQFAHNLIGKGTLNSFYLGMLIVRPVARLHRHSSNMEINNILSMNFGEHICNFLQSYDEELSSGGSNSKIQQACHAVLKLLNYMTTIKVPQYFATISHLQSLCNLLTRLIQRTIQTKDFINTKWIIRLSIKLHARATATTMIPTEETSYTSEFKSSISQIVNEEAINTLSSLVTEPNMMSILLSYTDDDGEDEAYVDSEQKAVQQRCMFYFLTFLTRSITKTSYTSFRPYLDSIIMNVLVPSLTISKSAIEDYENAPTEFLAEHVDVTDVIDGDVKYACLNCLKKIMRYDSEVTVPLVNLCAQLIEQGGRNLACALNIIGISQKSIYDEDLSKLIRRIIEINIKLEGDQEMWLRCLIYEFLSTVRFDVDVGSLPLSFDTNTSLPLLITSVKLVIAKAGGDLINPVQIMQVLLTVGEQENLEIVGELVDMLVEKYPQELGPYSCELIANLVGSFLRLLEEEQSNSGGGETENQLLGLLSNMQTIIMASNDGSINRNESVVEKITEMVTPVVDAVLNNALLDYVEGVIDICEALNNAGHCGASHLATVVESFTAYGSEYFEFYGAYFHSVFFYGDDNDKNVMTQLIGWLLEQNSEGLDTDDEELFNFVVDLGVEMALCGLGSEEYKELLELLYNSSDDKAQFWESKQTYRCVFAGMYKMSDVVMGMFGENVGELLQNFETIVEDGTWSTVFDLKIGIMGLMSFTRKFENNDQLREKATKLLSVLCDKVNSAISTRSALLKMVNGEQGVTSQDGESGSDNVSGNDDDGGDADLMDCDEFEELNKISVLDHIDVFGELAKYLGA